jgi:Fe-Mn family superoxide dismutase
MLTLPDLPFAYDALEPHMSEETLKLHHDKHHATYVDKANGILEGSDISYGSLEDLVRISRDTDEALFNNVGQHYNHCHFWEVMQPGGGAIPDTLARRLRADFGSVDEFKDAFKAAAVGQFGSGWCWLVERDGKLEVMATPNAENPLVHDARTLLGCDVWEHAYYLDHRNARDAYVDTFLAHLVNWAVVAGNTTEQEHAERRRTG